MTSQVANIASLESTAMVAPLTVTAMDSSTWSMHKYVGRMDTKDETRSLAVPHLQSSEDGQRYDGGGLSLYSASLRTHSCSASLSRWSSLASLPSLAVSDCEFGCFETCNEKPELTLASEILSVQCSCVATLKGAGDILTSSPDDDGIFCTASSSGLAPVVSWGRLKGNELCQCGKAESRNRYAVRTMTTMGDRLYTSHNDLKIRVWTRARKETRSCIGVSSGSGRYSLVAALPTMLDCVAKSLMPGGYKEVRRHHRKLWIEHADVVSAITVDCSRGYLYSASWDRSVRVWRLRDLKCIESFRAHDDAINALLLSLDGDVLYTAGANGKIKAWAGDAGSPCGHHLLTTLQAHHSAVNALALSEDGALLYSGACDKAIVVWRKEDGGTAQHASIRAGALRGHTHPVLSLATCDAVLCSGSADRTIRVWLRVAGPSRHMCVAALRGHSAPVKSLRLQPNTLSAFPPSPPAACLCLASASLDEEVIVWDINLILSS
ncbi:hypothetical protein KP509_15G069400 [Ceratopteris richardii]|uniref:Uncharacterized protein n=1 Tax=Ceratopteris richardii TaxID=49495 RepID=A0A8T2T8A7_CERRI|nr:hypothetical protein KP509_15G069400 [Ceratopteris richardii]